MRVVRKDITNPLVMLLLYMVMLTGISYWKVQYTKEAIDQSVFCLLAVNVML